MSVILAILSNKFVIGSGAALLAIVGAFIKGRASGAAKERQKTAEERLRARETADEIDDAIAGRTAEENRKRLSKWSAR
ncbi:hypothetical protein JYP46_01570 [Nitratireductor aquimarinus]|uniref:hypothetical protein n=1 Tax=Alphaproteobacteria TaxID=28211 RepID=UPI0019D3507D|nr:MULTISPECIES: hypothetical protein [Alphaproteobacteria]MBN7755500.1 hypothetical protein [Nitratireductor aquimarinus]MBY5998255.1 hypothetical protein [Tritonibacter mobilis]MBY6020284.1 hypothetical protein [Nitratireductor sp. DP7N14-4]